MKTPWPDRCLVLDGAAPAGDFTEQELAEASAFKLPKRREEWLLGRVAAKQLALRLGLADDPRRVTVDRPFLLIDGARSGWYVSLSHSTPYAAAAIAREPIGVDVQILRDVDARIAHLFLSPEEEKAMQRCTHGLLHFWCAKEAAFKQRSDEFATMRRLPLQLVEERADGLLFDGVETIQSGDVIVALTRPTSSAAP